LTCRIQDFGLQSKLDTTLGKLGLNVRDKIFLNQVNLLNLIFVIIV